MKRSTTLLASLLLSVGMLNMASAATLKMAYDADPVSLDPYEQLSGGTLQLSHMTLDPLVRWTQDLKFEPRLAEKWEQIDDKTTRFTLRKGVKFTSGNDFTAADVVFSVKRLKESPDFKAIFDAVKEVKAVDDYTVDLITDKPFPLLIHNATYIFPLDSQFYTGTDENGKPKDAITKTGDSFASTHLSGTGPFTITSREQGVKVEFARNPNYWDTKSPGNVDKIIFTAIKEDPTRVAALLSGDVDFIAPVPPNDLERVRTNENTDLVTMSGTRVITFQMNQARVEAFKNPKVRLAMDYAVNQAGIVEKIMKNFGTPAAQLSPKGYLGYNESLTPRYDLEKAKELMKEAGFAEGFSVTMLAPNNRYVNDEQIAQAVAGMLAKINIKVDLKTLPKAQYWPEFDARSADIMMIGWHSDTEDSNNFYEFLTACVDKDKGLGQYNSGNYCNPEADKLMHQANEVIDPAQRAELMQKIEKMLYDDAAFIPLHFQDLAWAANKKVDIKPIVNVLDFPYLGDLVIKE